MSVLIRGMDEIPEDGAVLMVKHDDNGKVYIKYAGMIGYSMELEKIKEPHGDLIDRDAIKQAVYRHLCIKGEENLLPAEKSIFGNLIKAQAIIKAEGAEE